MSDHESQVANKVFDEIRGTGAPEVEHAKIEEIIRGYFSGKRDSVRTAKFLDTEIHGRKASFEAMAIDISRTGVLLRITDEHFAKPAERDQLMPYTARVWFHFEDGLRVDFVGGKVRAMADVVRVTGYAGRGQELILVGCRFRSALTPGQCRKLGIEDGDDRPPSDDD